MPFNIDLENCSSAIKKGVYFLRQAQLEDGEFITLASANQQLVNGTFDSSPYATSLILYCLSFLPQAEIKDINQKAISFLLSQIEGPSIWRYWSKKHQTHKALPPDLDDICCISYVLKQHHIDIPSNKEILLASRDENGLFYTWLVPRKTASPEIKMTVSQHVGTNEIISVLVTNSINDIDSIVNTNVLFYLGDTAETKAASDYLINIIEQNLEIESTDYYIDPYTLYYMISRAYWSGVSSFGKIQKAIINKLVSKIFKSNSWTNELEAALAICTMINFQETDNFLLQTINFLLDRQGQDGSWPAATMFIGPAPYYGSAELTTAYCLEAIARYQSLL